MGRACFAAAFAFLTVAGSAAAADTAPFAVPPSPGRFCVSLSQGLSVLDGGYADSSSFYSAYWDAGETLSLRASADALPVFRADLGVSYRSFRSRVQGVDDLHAGHARLGASFRMPLSLAPRFLLDSDAVGSVRGPVFGIRAEAGLGVIDTTSDFLGRFYERTFTWSIAATACIEYRVESLALFIELGLDLLGAPVPSPGRWQGPDMILSFPVAFGFSLYMP